ncbi:UMP kinase [Candidatus Saccharibacteria bacterium]|nr:UMP kinase [Candidatus Saccharibacteria bacterium]
MYKRILLKVSGEQLAGEHETGIDPNVVAWIASEAKKIVESGCQLVIIAGGGNLVRGAEMAGNGIKRVTADQMGMLSGLINAMAMTDIFEANGVPTRCLSNIYAEQVAENFSFRLAEKHLEGGRVLIVAGGIGRPYSTHDSAAVLVGLELGCELVIKSTKVDGVYDKDPNKYDDAVKFDTISYQQALENPEIKVMDKSAMGLAAEQGVKVVVMNLHEPDGLIRLVNGEHVGTLIS